MVAVTGLQVEPPLPVAVAVGVRVGVLVGAEPVGVRVGVTVGPPVVAVRVGVRVGVAVGPPGVAVRVGVRVGVADKPLVAVRVGVRVAVRVAVGPAVGVRVGVGPPVVLITKVMVSPTPLMLEIFSPEAEPFHQLDGSSIRHYGGIGLGLALVKQIVEAHGSTVKVQSYPSLGSTFSFDLPIAMS